MLKRIGEILLVHINANSLKKKKVGGGVRLCQTGQMKPLPSQSLKSVTKVTKTKATQRATGLMLLYNFKQQES